MGLSPGRRSEKIKNRYVSLLLRAAVFATFIRWSLYPQSMLVTENEEPTETSPRFYGETFGFLFRSYYNETLSYSPFKFFYNFYCYRFCA